MEFTRRGTELPGSDQAQPPMNGALTQGATSLQATKRQRDGTSECDMFLAKRARLTSTDPRGVGVEEKKLE